MKPLKILLGNNTLSLLAGSETWTYTLAMQLKKMGHDVSCFGSELGIISDKLKEAGIPCFNYINTSGAKPFSFILEKPVKHEYDVIISNHHDIVVYLRSQFPKTPIISTIHGIIHFSGEEKAPEHPALDAGVNQFISVSKEIQEKLLADYNIDSIVIHNFFDLQKFGSLKAPNERPRRFLINSNYHGKESEEVQVIRDAAKIMGAKVAAIGANFTQSFETEKAVEDADVVFGMGRSVMEGVAAGRLGISHGRWGTGGPIVDSNLESVRAFNFSGRNSKGKIATAQELVAMIEKYYQPQFLAWGKEMVAREHNVVFAAEQYVRIARELTGQTITRPLVNEAVDPMARPFKLAK